MDLRHLQAELDAAIAELRAHLASWDYAFAMGSSADGATAHPRHRAARERAERLDARVCDLRARIAEHQA